MLISLDRDSPKACRSRFLREFASRLTPAILRPGTLVPSSRILASQLKVSRNPVIFGYERLINEGYLVARPMVGTFIAESCRTRRSMQAKRRHRGFSGSSESRETHVFSGRQHAILNNSSIPIDFWTQRLTHAPFR